MKNRITELTRPRKKRSSKVERVVFLAALASVVFDSASGVFAGIENIDTTEADAALNALTEAQEALQRIAAQLVLCPRN